LGGGGEITNIDLAKRIVEIIKSPLLRGASAQGGRGVLEDWIEFIPDRLGHDLRYAIDSTKAQKELSWKKEIDFEQGLKETIEWYKNNENWWKRLK